MKKLLALLLVVSLFAAVALSASAASTNIALGKTETKQISTHSGVAFYNADLTDGEAATTMKYGDPDKEWFSFYYSAAATGEGNINVEHSTDSDGKDVNVGTVVVDLASVSTIESIKIHFEKDYLPEVAELLVSEDGTNYTKYTSMNVTTESGEVVENGMWVEFKADTATGRYVKLVCTFSKMFCMLNEIEVYGTENTGSGTTDNSSTDDGKGDETTSEAPAASSEAPAASSEAPAASSTAPATSSTSKPATGDEGVIVFALLAVVAVAGAVVAVRVRH